MSTAPRRLGKYELMERLGEGGMAEVWKASDTQLRRYVAIKILHANFQSAPDFVTRFQREAQVIASLRHPNIVQIHDFHISQPPESESTLAYMVMEYIEGSTLADYIRSTSRAGKFPAAADILHLFSSISMAIDYAHHQGMVHRDIKPANILLNGRNTTLNHMGEPILSDFGIAKLLGATTATMSGSWLGTPLYVSPEQAMGHPGNERSDIYSLGAMLYEVLTGVPPFQGPSPAAIMMQHLNTLPTPPALINPSIPPALTVVMLRSLAKDPAARFPTAGSLTAALAEAVNMPVPAGLVLPAYPADSMNMPTFRTSQPAAGISPPWIGGGGSSSQPYPPVGQRQSAQPASLSADSGTPAYPPQSSATPPLSLSPVTPPGFGVPAQPRVNATPIVPLEKASGIPSALPAQGTVGSTPSTVQHVPPAQLSPLPPSSQNPLARKRLPFIVLLALLIPALLGGGILTFFLLLPKGRGDAGPTTGLAAGTAYFVSSGRVDRNATNSGINDEFQLNLKDIQNPAPGKGYYAWLLEPGLNQALRLNDTPLLLSQGVIEYHYPGDPNHTNLLAKYSEFILTQENAGVVPVNPTDTYSYFAQLPQTKNPNDPSHYSLLDHLRHLLAKDSKLEGLMMNGQPAPLHGGLNLWFFLNTEKIMEWASAAKDESDRDTRSRHITRILSYLDSLYYVQLDVPTRPFSSFVNDQYAQVALLDLGQASELHPQVPGYLAHIGTHLRNLVASPGVTPEKKQLAEEITKALDQINAWLRQVREEAKALITQLRANREGPDTQELVEEMFTNALYAFVGRIDPATGRELKGASQIYLDIQQLASFEVQPYKA